MLPSTSEVLGETDRTLARQGRAALCQIVRTEGSTPGKAGWKMLVRTDGTVCGNLGGGAFEAMVGADASERLRLSGPSSEIKRYYLTEEAVRGEATGMVCGGMAEVLLEVRPRLEGLPFHAPIGLPIGGDTPGEIAVSVLAEIIQARTQGAAASVEPKEARGAV